MVMQRLLLLLPVFLLLASRAAATESSDWNAATETAVVYNTNDPAAAALAQYYMTRRGLRPDRLVALACSRNETITRADFESTIRRPLQQQFVDRGWWRMEEREVVDHVSKKPRRTYAAARQLIRVVVLIRGMPLRIGRTQETAPAAREDEASVDSEIAAMGLGSNVTAGALPNPYFNKAVHFPLDQSSEGMLLVARLDAASDATVRRMIDDAIETEARGLLGRAVVDLALRTGGYQQGEQWLQHSARSFNRAGIPTYVDRKPELIDAHWPLPDTALYFGWYDAEVQGPFQSTAFRFARGAVACHLHSFSARTMRDGTQAWAAPLLERGAAATLGNVWEPYLSYTTHFHLMNDRLLEGFTLAEAAWSATPGLSWMNVVIGDPLYRPFAHRTLPEESMKAYALFQGLVDRHRNDAASADFKRAVVDLADKKDLPALLELLALHVSVEGQLNEASRLLQHARSKYDAPQDRLRTLLLEADALRQLANGLPADDAERLLRESRELAVVDAHHLVRSIIAVDGEGQE
jgi:uncharacterized protein (TIGR03790 family)